MALDGPNGLTIEAERRGNAGRMAGTGAIGIVDDHRAAQALRRTAAELCPGHPEIFAQEIVHRQLVAHLHRAIGATVDRQRECRHAKAPFSIFWVTGSDWKRCPVASKIAFSSAGTTGIITTSAMPFGASVASSGGSISISK